MKMGRNDNGMRQVKDAGDETRRTTNKELIS
jgi:hypothetical protein